jgi:16S rRNA (guanine527-N7)-methyltransferase
MDRGRIAELLKSFLAVPLSDIQLESISTYINILERWNQKVNLTAVRRPEEVVTRHFGESLFAAQRLFPSSVRVGADAPVCPAGRSAAIRLIDVGSGAGFPGLPIKLWAPAIHLTLIESNAKKATFLREVIRALTLTYVNVFAGRADDFSGPAAEVVTLRAVERFESALPVAARLVAPQGRLALLIGQAQVDQVLRLAPDFEWPAPLPLPLSSERVFVVGMRTRT